MAHVSVAGISNSPEPSTALDGPSPGPETAAPFAIEHIEAIAFTLGYRRPLRTSRVTFRAAEHVLVRVRTREGITGVGEAMARPFVYGESQQSIVTAVQEWFGPAIRGLSVFQTERIWGRLARFPGNHTARGALDVAVHDAQGKALGVPTWQLLGGYQDRLRVTRVLGISDPGTLVAEAQAALADYGITSFKVKINGDVDSAAASLARLRQELGPDVTIYADANQSLTLEAAAWLAERMVEQGILLLEEPLPITARAQRTRLAQSAPVAIMADESAKSASDVVGELQAGRAGAVSVKIPRTGYTESARVLAIADSLHSRVLIGTQGESALGATAACVFGAARATTSVEPAELDHFLRLADQIVTTVPQISDGHMHVDIQTPGLGVEVDEDKLAYYRTT